MSGHKSNTCLTVEQFRNELEMFMQCSLEPALEKTRNQICQHICSAGVLGRRHLKTQDIREDAWPLGRPSPTHTRIFSNRSYSQASSKSLFFREDLDSQGDISTKPFENHFSEGGLLRRFVPIHRSKLAKYGTYVDLETPSTADGINGLAGTDNIDEFFDDIESEPMLPQKPALANHILRASSTGAVLKSCVASQEPKSQTREFLLKGNSVMRLGDSGTHDPDHQKRSADVSTFRRVETIRGELDCCNYIRARVLSLVTSTRFDVLFTALVILNAMSIGVETDLYAWSFQQTAPTTSQRGHNEASDQGWLLRLLRLADTIFCIMFAIELALRLIAFGGQFFCNKPKEVLWNLFDLVVCAMQIVEEIALFSAAFRMPIDASIFRVLRMMRVVRIFRIFRRSASLGETFSTIMSSIMSSLVSLSATVSLLLLFLYAISVFITQLVIEAGDTGNAEGTSYWFGNLGRTYLTMFESIFGGVSWDESVSCLMSDISPWLGVLYSAFVAFCQLSILNMATAVFVNKSLRKAQQDIDIQTANRIGELFFPEVAGEATTITYEEFCSKCNTPEMQDYFEDINVDPSAAKFLYQLLDVDGNGSVDRDGLQSGCMRIRGNAKALELHLMLHETTRMHERMSNFQAWVTHAISRISAALESDAGLGSNE